MDVYVFVFEAIPTKGASEYGKIGGAHVDIWVLESSRNKAEVKAKSFLIDYSCDIVKLENEFVMNDDLIVQYREDAQANYYKAKKEGISAFFSAWPLVDHEDDFVEISSMGNPKINKTIQ